MTQAPSAGRPICVIAMISLTKGQHRCFVARIGHFQVSHTILWLHGTTIWIQQIAIFLSESWSSLFLSRLMWVEGELGGPSNNLIGADNTRNTDTDQSSFSKYLTCYTCDPSYSGVQLPLLLLIGLLRVPNQNMQEALAAMVHTDTTGNSRQEPDLAQQARPPTHTSGIKLPCTERESMAGERDEDSQSSTSGSDSNEGEPAVNVSTLFAQ